jgi:CRP-like cAMP-binding protein
MVVPLLRRVDLLEGVDEPALRDLGSSGRILDLEPGEYVIRQGEYGDTLYVVLRGKFGVEIVGDDGKKREVGDLGAGHYFGEMAMVGHGERSASVHALTRASVLELRQVPFQQALKRFKQVRGRIEDAYARRAMSSFARRSRLFRDLPPETTSELLVSASLTAHSKGDVIVAEGSSAQTFFVIRNGFVRVSRKVPSADREEVLAYLGPEDFFGDQELASAEPTYATTVTALEPVEVIRVPRGAFWKLHQRQPEMLEEFRRYQIRRTEQQQLLNNNRTAMKFVSEMLESGLAQARSALIINMEACVRCGNCVQACDDLHGYSRIARRGKKLTRRIEQDKRAHESLYFPTSCLQCATPECMVGCPTGSISRDTGGEVFIRDTCIGCGNCARNCDFGNISMAKAKHEEPSILDLVLGAQQTASSDAKADLIAVKCDVCFERNHAACVYNCPTQAILRIDPRSYFEELRRVAPKLVLEAGASGAKTTTTRPSRWIDGVLQILTALVSIVGGYAVWRTMAPSSWEGIGWAAGVTSACMMGLLALMGLRKRLRTVAIGSLATWAKAHAILGGLFYGVVLFHAGYRASSGLTAMLLAMVTITCVVGALGQIANAILPRLIARTEDEAVLPEDAVPQMRALRLESEELLATLEGEARRRVEANVQRLARGVFSAFKQGQSPKRFPAFLEARARKLPALGEAEHAVAIRVASNLMTWRMHRIQRALEVIMIGWVPIHLVASCVALLLMVGHIMTVALW